MSVLTWVSRINYLALLASGGCGLFRPALLRPYLPESWVGDENDALFRQLCVVLVVAGLLFVSIAQAGYVAQKKACQYFMVGLLFEAWLVTKDFSAVLPADRVQIVQIAIAAFFFVNLIGVYVLSASPAGPAPAPKKRVVKSFKSL
jgi:hypothetical protein